MRSPFWEFWANYLKSRLQLHYVVVHRTYSAKVIKITTTSTTHSLTRIVRVSGSGFRVGFRI